MSFKIALNGLSLLPTQRNDMFEVVTMLVTLIQSLYEIPILKEDSVSHKHELLRQLKTFKSKPGSV